MKYIKWIKVTLKPGICYIIQKMVVNSEQIWFYQKGWVEAREGPLSAPLYAQKGTLQVVMLFGVGRLTLVDVWGRSGNDATNC